LILKKIVVKFSKINDYKSQLELVMVIVQEKSMFLPTSKAILLTDGTGAPRHGQQEDIHPKNIVRNTQLHSWTNNSVDNNI